MRGVGPPRARASEGKEPMRVAHFIQRYPPALGGSEAYFARLSRYLVGAGARAALVADTTVSVAAVPAAAQTSPPATNIAETPTRA